MIARLIYLFFSGMIVIALPVFSHLIWKRYRQAVFKGGLLTAGAYTTVSLIFHLFLAGDYSGKRGSFVVISIISLFVSSFLISSIWAAIIGLPFYYQRKEGPPPLPPVLPPVSGLDAGRNGDTEKPQTPL